MSRTDELLIKVLLNETSTEENTEVQQWLAEDPTNKVYFEDFKRIWETSKKLEPTSTIDEEVAWAKFKTKTAAHVKPEAILVPLKKKSFGWMKIAAVLLVAAAAWGAYALLNPLNYIDIEAGKEVVVKTLPDGSVVTMNKNTALSFASNFTDHRSIRLQHGDVFFNVTPNKAKPFVIEADKVSIKVVGTSFNVKHLNKQTEVIVETGIVKVSRGSESVELRKGEKVLIEDGTGTLTKQQNTGMLYNYYRSQTFVLNVTPLTEVIDKLNEAYDTNIVINDPKIKALTMSTILFKKKGLDNNLQIICETLNLKINRNDGKILLSK